MCKDCSDKTFKCWFMACTALSKKLNSVDIQLKGGACES